MNTSIIMNNPTSKIYKQQELKRHACKLEEIFINNKVTLKEVVNKLHKFIIILRDF